MKINRLYSSIFSILTFQLNDVNMRSKILILYIFCVFIPIISINTIFYLRISDNLYKQEIRNINMSMDRIAENISGYIEDIVTISHILHVDRTLYEGIEQRYSSFRDFFIAYEQFLSFTLNKYFPVFPHMENITIYTDNDTIGNAGVFRLLSDDLLESDWYNTLSQDPNSLLLHFSFMPDPFAPRVTRRRLSLIRELNHFPAHFYSVEKFLRIDLRFTLLDDVLRDENLYGTLFILNGQNEVIYSSNPEYMEYSTSMLHRFDDIEFDSQRTMLYKHFDRFIRDWRLAVALPPDAFYAILHEARWFVVYLTLANLIFCTFVILALSKSLTRRLADLTGHIQSLKDENLNELTCKEGKDEIGRLIVAFNEMIKKMQSLIYDVYQSNIQKKNLQIERKQAQVNALQSQINPHFLFNSLETIRMRSVLKNETETADVIKSLSKTFRQLLHWSSDLIPIKEEIGFIEDYLKIQKYRFGDRFNYIINLEDNVKDLNIPKMTIQPFIENACVHGIEKSKNEGLLEIIIKNEDGFVHIHVTDNGKGMDKNSLDNLLQDIQDEEYKGNSIGIKNVYARLKLFYKDEFNFNIESKSNEGTKILIKVPLTASV